ncbi:MAG: beta-N-acetylhexosaminidase, partial [Solirubrobacteraceae bacterium]|nr:beta-N-acetylhexosaminidase [Solirubrobacteraceae bacterium]
PPPPAALTAIQLAGQRVVFAFSGTTVPPRLRLRIQRGEAAGVLLFGDNVRSVAQTRRLTRALQAIPRPAGLTAPLVVMTDQEGGEVKRIPGAPHRSPPQLAVTGRPSEAAKEGRATARTLRAAGVNIDLAPVVDVARPGSEMEREGRSFGRSASLVTRFGAAFAGGLTAGGVAPTFKHFPGFGAASANTDAQQVVIPASLDTLQRFDEAPYAGSPTPLVMISSAIYPALDPGVPALLSSRIVTGELRVRLGFTGVTVSDWLNSGSLTGRANVVLRAARAGDDLLLFRTYLASARAVEGLAAALRDGRLDHGQAQASVARVLALRAKLAH